MQNFMRNLMEKTAQRCDHSEKSYEHFPALSAYAIWSECDTFERRELFSRSTSILLKSSFLDSKLNGESVHDSVIPCSVVIFSRKQRFSKKNFLHVFFKLHIKLKRCIFDMISAVLDAEFYGESFKKK